MNRPIRIPARYTVARENPPKNCRAQGLALQALDFSIIDTLLYLDAYPSDTRALEYLNRLKGERTQLLAERNSNNCPPLTATESTENGFRWIEGPWPWEYEANEGD